MKFKKKALVLPGIQFIYG